MSEKLTPEKVEKLLVYAADVNAWSNADARPDLTPKLVRYWLRKMARFALHLHEKLKETEQICGILCERCGWGGIRANDPCAYCEVDRLAEEAKSLRQAITSSGYSVLETSGAWSIHDTSDFAKVEHEKTLAVIAENCDLKAERDSLREQLQEHGGEHPEARQRRARAISDALGIQDESTTKQVEAIRAMRVELAQVHGELINETERSVRHRARVEELEKEIEITNKAIRLHDLNCPAAIFMSVKDTAANLDPRPEREVKAERAYHEFKPCPSRAHNTSCDSVRVDPMGCHSYRMDIDKWCGLPEEAHSTASERE